MKLPKLKIDSKPNYINFANDVDLFVVFKKIANEFDNCFLFESLGEKTKTSRYSVIGFDPDHIIRAKDKKLYFDDELFEVDNPYYALREIVPQDIISRRYAGGLVGYLGYDCINYFEPSVSVKLHKEFDQFMFGVFTDGLIFDNVTNQLFYFYYKKNRLKKIEDILEKELVDEKVKVQYIKDTLTKQGHADLVNSTKKYIEDGFTFQCEVGFKSNYKIKGNDLLIYEKLREINPSPYMYYLKFSDKKIIGASPELLFCKDGNEIETHPLAGTIKRGVDESEDRVLARDLLNDKKENAEHNMLVDMHRNDIGRVSQFGSVRIQELKDIKRFKYVQHIGSEISGLIRPDKDMFSGLANILPGGVLTGAPKIETIKIIDDNETEARGPYGGGVGYFGLNGDATFAIPIRTLFLAGENAYTQTCSGIVYDSDPDKEYDEIKRKLEGMKNTLGEFISICHPDRSPDEVQD